MKKILYLVLLLILVVAESCREKCKGEPAVIFFGDEDYPIEVLLKNNKGENIFKSDFYLAKLEIYRDDTLAKYSIDYNDTTLLFSTNIKHDLIFDYENTLTYYLKLDNSTIDTLQIHFLPKRYPEGCNSSEYVYVRWNYNNVEVNYSENSTIFSKTTIIR